MLELAEARERFLAAPEEFQTRVHAINRLASERCPVRSYTLTHLRRILGKKNLVEYESRLFSQREAQELVQHAERFLGWARTQITPSPAR